MTKDMTQRDAFWIRVYELAKENRDVMVVSADMGAPALDRFRTDLPGQFVNTGIAEQNAIVIASGLAMKGKRPFVYAIAPFITLRCLEQIRVENGIMNIPITVVGVGAGFGYDDSGPTHHLTEDIAVMRSMPNVVIHSISDNVMAQAVAEMSCTLPMTNYIRLDRKPFDGIYTEGEDFTGGLKVLSQGKDGVIVATGAMVHSAIAAARQLKKVNIDLGVVDLFTIPINAPIFIEKVSKSKRIITLEEHFLPGGMGSAVCEVLCDNGMTIPVKRIGLAIEKEYCYQYGGRKEIRRYYGIHEEGIIEQIKDFVSG